MSFKCESYEKSIVVNIQRVPFEQGLLWRNVMPVPSSARPPNEITVNEQPIGKEQNMCRSKSFIGLAIRASVVLLVAMLLSPAQVSLQAKDSFMVRYIAKFSVDDLSFGKFMGYDVVALKGASYPEEPGVPMLPSIQLHIALPPGMAARSVRVVNTTEEEIPEELTIFPVQPPRRTMDSEDMVFVEPHLGIYSSEQPYPSELAKLVYQADLAGQGVAVVRLYPVQYVPTDKKLRLYTSISFAVEGVGGYECSDYLSPNASDRSERTYEQALRGIVVNPEDVNLRTGTSMKSTILDGGPFDHVIITSGSYSSHFQPLVEWHTQKGVKDTVITTDWIYANYTGSSDQERIRNFVIDAYVNWGTMYILLGGEHGTVPFEYRTYYDGESTPSDQYYSDFDDDWLHEVFVGRVSTEGATQVSTFVDKVLKYEKDPPRTDYLLNVMLMARDEVSEDLKEIICGYIPPRFDIIRTYDPVLGCSGVIDYLNQGQHLVNQAGPASSVLMWASPVCCLYRPHVDALINDNRMSIVVSAGLHANQMDYEDCIAEHFVVHNPLQAGVAFTGNTRSAYTLFGQPDALSGKLDKNWWISLFFWDTYNLGWTLIDAKHRFSNSSQLERHCEWTFNLLGEPEMPIWTDEPRNFAVTCPSRLPKENACPFVAHVEDSTTHDPVVSAYVCLWKEGEIYLTGYTDVEGNINFDPSPSTGGVMYLTVTERNYIPYQQEIEILPCICGDANGDGVIDISDIIFEINFLYRGGPPPDPIECADVNCDGVEDVADLVYKINFLFRNGFAPCHPDG